MRSDERATGHHHWRVEVAAAALVGAAVLGMTACGSSEEPAAPTTTAATSSSGTKAPGSTSTTTKTSGTTPGTTKTNGTTPPGTDVGVANGSIEADETATDVTWTLNASEFQGRDGLLVAYDCTPDGIEATVWGDGVYTDDSSVCTAAVHAGLITIEDGGRVVIEISEGLDAYETSTANGITTYAYASWPGSFEFPGT